MNQLSAQLRRYFDDFVGKERSREFPPEIINAFQELSELPKHLSIDLEGLLRQAASEGTANRSFRQALLGFLRRFFHDDIRRDTENCLERIGTDHFLRANEETLRPFFDGLLSQIETALNRLKSGSTEYKEEVVKLHQRLTQQEQECFKLQEDERKQLSHTSRDYQQILTHLGAAPTGTTEREIQHILESGLEDMGITVLWERPKNDIGQYFVTQNDTQVTSSHVSRPCLVRGETVIHKGVVINPVNN